MSKETVGQRLKRLREQAGLTQKQVADAAKMPLGTLRNWEQGLRTPPFVHMARILRSLGVEADVFADCVEGAAKQRAPRGRPRAKKA